MLKDKSKGLRLKNLDNDILLIVCLDEKLSTDNVTLDWFDLLKQSIKSTPCKGVVIDLGNVVLMTSYALQQLINLRTDLLQMSLPFAICRLNANLRSLFHVTMLETIFTIGEDIPDSTEAICEQIAKKS